MGHVTKLLDTRQPCQGDLMNILNYISQINVKSVKLGHQILINYFQQVRIQTSPVGTFPTTLRAAFPRILKEEGVNGFYKSLVPLWGRQIPYTMMKFACFEKTVEALYQYVVPKPRADCTKAEQLVVTFAAGYIAGVFCAIVSHPADTLVSYLNKAPGSGIGDAVNVLGFKGLWMGLGPRIIMIGTLTALQWFIYDGVKVLFRNEQKLSKAVILHTW